MNLWEIRTQFYYNISACSWRFSYHQVYIYKLYIYYKLSTTNLSVCALNIQILNSQGTWFWFYVFALRPCLPMSSRLAWYLRKSSCHGILNILITSIHHLLRLEGGLLKLEFNLRFIVRNIRIISFHSPILERRNSL